MGISGSELSAKFPRLYHMAHRGSWRKIFKYGLLSTSALLDFYGIKGDERFRIESCHRAKCIPINHHEYGEAVIRDQRPMPERALARALSGAMTPSEWYREINSRVFFWLTEFRLRKFLAAYSADAHDVLFVDTKRLLQRCADRVQLSHINSGSAMRRPAERGRDTFKTMADFPFREKKKFVELAIPRRVCCIRDFVIEVRECQAGRDDKLIWP
jgi:hypothetical protein